MEDNHKGSIFSDFAVSLYIEKHVPNVVGLCQYTFLMGARQRMDFDS